MLELEKKRNMQLEKEIVAFTSKVRKEIPQVSWQMVKILRRLGCQMGLFNFI